MRNSVKLILKTNCFLLLFLFRLKGFGQSEDQVNLKSYKVDTIIGNFYIEGAIMQPSHTLAFGKIIKFKFNDSLLYTDGIFINGIHPYYRSLLDKKGVKIDEASLNELKTISRQILWNYNSVDTNYERKYKREVYYKTYLKFEYIQIGIEKREIPNLFLKNQLPLKPQYFIKHLDVPIFLITKVFGIKSGFVF